MYFASNGIYKMFFYIKMNSNLILHLYASSLLLTIYFRKSLVSLTTLFVLVLNYQSYLNACWKHRMIRAGKITKLLRACWKFISLVGLPDAFYHYWNALNCHIWMLLTNSNWCLLTRCYLRRATYFAYTSEINFTILSCDFAHMPTETKELQ